MTFKVGDRVVSHRDGAGVVTGVCLGYRGSDTFVLFDDCESPCLRKSSELWTEGEIQEEWPEIPQLPWVQRWTSYPIEPIRVL